eukprot:TRINITY_DN6896_c0_g1_i1.p2 TRINITY_DN6896_c0_g1~~TRINITY_DN6896_c0_g1_i1.p2  ORF type:complete len:55 (+),score=1.42 TRINITY_DN6896_c0_g1_i1:371-535(+)
MTQGTFKFKENDGLNDENKSAIFKQVSNSDVRCVSAKRYIEHINDANQSNKKRK